MGSDWIEVSLAEVSDRIGDGLHGTPTYTDNGDYPFINGNNLEYGSIVIKDGTKRVSKDEYLKHKKDLTDNTVLVSINGTIGNVALYAGEDVVLGKSACYINLKNGVSKHFIRYVLSGYLFQEYIQRCSTGSTIKNVSLKMMREFRFKMPKTEAEQLEVIQSVRNLDNKITLNRQINQTLEQMAQVLFKSWFVDFDPVIDNAVDAGKVIPDELQARAEQRQALRNAATQQGDASATPAGSAKPLPDNIRQLFPSEFEESELGWVPKGWVNHSFGDLLENTIGGDWGKDVEDDKHTTQSRIIRGTDIPDLISGQLSKAPLRWVEPKKLKTRKIETGDIIIEVSGGSPKQPTGRSLFMTQSILERLGGVVEPASFCRRFKPKSFNLGLLASLHLQKIYADGKMWEYQNQSTGIANFQTKFFLEAENVLVPSDDVLNAFCNVVMPMIEKSQNNEQIMLTELRDTLLPKLISGELRLDEVESTIKETITA